MILASLKLPVESSAVEDAGDESPEEDLREEDVEEDAEPRGVPHLHEHVLPHPVNLKETNQHRLLSVSVALLSSAELKQSETLN